MLECTIWPICYIFTVHFLSNHKLLLEASSLTCNFVIQTNLIICRGAWYMAKISKKRKVHRLCVTEILISFLLYSLENKNLVKWRIKAQFMYRNLHHYVVTIHGILSCCLKRIFFSIIDIWYLLVDISISLRFIVISKNLYCISLL